MAANISEHAVIDPRARLAEDVEIGPFCLVGPHVAIGRGTRLLSHVTIKGNVTIGEHNVFHPGVVIGGEPQDLSYRGEPTRLQIGSGCTIREGVTMNVGTIKGGGLTRVGDRGFFMNNSHVGHDCTVGNDVIFATSATLGGHCQIGDFVYIGGLSAVHQFTRVGPQVMIGGVCGVRGDIIPFGLANGQHAVLDGLNLIGMKRRKFTKQRLATVRAFYQKLFHGPGIFAERLAAAQPMAAEDPAIAEILTFIAQAKHRALCLPAAN